MTREALQRDDTPIAVASRSFSQHAALQGQSLIEFARGRRKLITALERIDGRILDALPQLEVISKFGVGTDMLDLPALVRHGTRLGWTGGVNKRSVTELAIAFMISLLRHIRLAGQEMNEGAWRTTKGRQLSDRTVGVVGCGHVGKDLTAILRAFGCRVLAHDILDFPEFYAAHQVEPVGLEELLALAIC
jgi:phosphoglycerate dehydrogenase-like enzyme